MKVLCEPIASPIRFVVAHLPAALRNIAPERSEKIVDEVANFTLLITNYEYWAFETLIEAKEIIVSSRAMEILWATAYGHFVIYRELAAAKVAAQGGDVAVNLAATDELQSAARLLQWAVEELANSQLLRPPPPRPMCEDLPRPLEDPAKGTNEYVVDELALCAAAFLLHHEVAHNRLRHYPAPGAPTKPPKRKAGPPLEFDAHSITQEQDADYDAADWLLAGLSTKDSRFVKRALGIVVALIPEASLAIHIGKHGGRTHPRPYDRVLHILDRFVANDGWHVVWAFLGAAMKLHFDNSTEPLEASGAYDNFRAAVDGYAELLAWRQSP